MTTIDELRNRLELEYLEPINELSPSVPIVGSITASGGTIVITDGIFSPDEESLIGPGTVMEIDSELVFVTDYNMSTMTITCDRGHLNSVPAAHDDGAFIRLVSRWPRYLQSLAIRDAIDGLFPPLFVVQEERVPTSAAGFLDLPLTTVEVHRVQIMVSGVWQEVEAIAYPTHPLDDGIGFIRLETGVPDSFAVIGYGIKIENPEDDETTIAYLPQKWERLVIVDAAIALLSGVDIDAVTQEYLTESLRLERFPVRSAEAIVRSLITYREYMVDRFQNEQLSQSPPMVIRHDLVVLD